MRILINCSNLKIGGGLQVAHSFLHELRNYQSHIFFVVLSTTLEKQIDRSEFPGNFHFINYNIKPSAIKSITGSDKFLSKVVKEHSIDSVFSVFGPTYWKPKVNHICGFAKPQYIYLESPFFKQLSLMQKLRLNFKRIFHMYDFLNNNVGLITESEDVSIRLRKKMPHKEVFTVTNYYNQIFDNSESWNKEIELPQFNGFTLLTISTNYPHKNLSIIPSTIEYLNSYKGFNFRFVLTIDRNVFANIKEKSIKDRILTIGKVNFNQCPNLYEQCSAVFLPTLLECFTVTYPEAMRMRKPILTSDLNFARGLCGNAAIYFDPLNPKDIAEKIYSLAMNSQKEKELIDDGVLQLKMFDTYSIRAKKYLEIITS